MENLEKLYKEKNDIICKIRRIEEKKLKEKTLPKLRKDVGKCYKYMNSYGGNSSRWPLYIKIISIDERNNWFKVLEFQNTSENILEIRHNVKINFEGQNYFERYGWSNYQEITKSEFNAAKKRLLKKIDRLMNN